MPDTPLLTIMADLYLVAASFCQLPQVDVTRSLTEYFTKQRTSVVTNAVLLCPDAIAIPDMSFAQLFRYPGRIGLEFNRENWWPLRQASFGQVYVLGTQPIFDYEEIVLACFLKASRRHYLTADGKVIDVADWHSAICQDTEHRSVRVERLTPEAQTQYIRQVHLWLASELIAADFTLPRAHAPRSPDISLYVQPRLGLDLAQLAGLQHEAHGQPFSTFMLLDGSIVRSMDFYRSLANYVAATENADSVLDAGCGSGLLAGLLAGTRKFERVVGVDSSPTRIASARLHGALTDSAATFEVRSVTDLQFPDKSFDLVVTSFALEQTGGHLGIAVRELARVARKLLILFEPSTEYFPTIPSMWHVPRWGWANSYSRVLTGLGYPFSVRPNLLRHYYNPGSVFVVDLTGKASPALSHPQLFSPDPEEWPGGVEYL